MRKKRKRMAMAMAMAMMGAYVFLSFYFFSSCIIPSFYSF